MEKFYTKCIKTTSNQLKQQMQDKDARFDFSKIWISCL